MNVKFLGFVTYVDAIIYLLLHNLDDCTFNEILKLKVYVSLLLNLQELIPEPVYNSKSFEL